MTQARPPRRPPAAPSSPLPGIISAAVVLVVLGLVVGLLISRAGQGAGASQSEAGATSAPTSAQAAQPTSAPAAPAAPIAGLQPTATTYSYSAAPELTIDPARRYTATISTPRGDILVELLPELAPQTVNSFVFLARNNFYNGLTWHRVLPGFMAQGGDPTGTGGGGPGYTIPDEFTTEVSFDRPGILAMARPNAPDSAGSQFFITTGPAEWLNGQYTVFGRVLEGQEIVDGIPLRNPENPEDLATPGEAILGIAISEE